jgi:hypothetical protein
VPREASNAVIDKAKNNANRKPNPTVLDIYHGLQQALRKGCGWARLSRIPTHLSRP